MQPKVIENTLAFSVETWDDPGDYPSNAGSGPLPSYNYAICEGDVIVEEDFDDFNSLVPTGFDVTKWETFQVAGQKRFVATHVSLTEQEEDYD